MVIIINISPTPATPPPRLRVWCSDVITALRLGFAFLQVIALCSWMVFAHTSALVVRPFGAMAVFWELLSHAA